MSDPNNESPQTSIVCVFRGGELIDTYEEESTCPPERTKAILNELFLYLRSGKPITKDDEWIEAWLEPCL